jgi:hypothetical protein
MDKQQNLCQLLFFNLKMLNFHPRTWERMAVLARIETILEVVFTWYNVSSKPWLDCYFIQALNRMVSIVSVEVPHAVISPINCFWRKLLFIKCAGWWYPHMTCFLLSSLCTVYLKITLNHRIILSLSLC